MNKQVKVSFFLKIMFFLINFLGLLNFLVLYKFFSINNFFVFIFVVLNFFNFFFILKGKLWAVKLAFILPFIMAFSGIYALSSIFLFLNFSLLFTGELESFSYYFVGLVVLFLIYFVFLFLLHRKLKKFEKLPEKYFINKKQEKIYSILFIITIILLLIFKFGYYEKDYKIDVPEDFFVTTLENKEVDSEENLYFVYQKNQKLKIEEEYKFRRFKENIFACLYKDKCYFEKQEYKDGVEYFKNFEKFEQEKSDLRKKGQKLNGDLNRIQYKIKNLENKDLELLKQEKQLLKDYEENKEKQKELEKLWIINKAIYYNKPEKYKNLEGKDRVDVKRLLRKNFEKIFLNPENEEKLKKFLSLSETKYFKEGISFEGNILIYSFLLSSSRELLYEVAFLLENGEEEKAIEILKKQLNISFKILHGDSTLISVLVSIAVLNFTSEGIEGFLNKFDLSEKSKKELLEIFEKYKFSTEKILKNNVKFVYKHRDYQINYIFENDLFNFGDLKLDIKSLSSLYDLELVKKIEKKYHYDLIKNNFEHEFFKIKFFSKNILGQYIARDNLYFLSNSNIYKLKKLEELQNNLIEKLKK